ncbi:hypothetical protein NQ318_021705 [Aromia moschata]|uniref:DUF4817 domain-containing protein n=1 Tax=Aromia moschata TaxID=1265417 RepID=A0AAV8X981_9CUCU|nr:hypothetical protein NQ318_021705 [Aromia moschata]
MSTHNEKVDMLLVYGESQKNPRRAVQLCAQRYSERVIPSLKIFARLERNLRANNEAFSSRKGRTIVKRAILTILLPLFCSFEDHPRNSIRQVCRELNLKYSYQENGYHDYKLHNLEHLSDPHQQRRINYVAQVMINLEINNNWFFHHVLWTDESRFVSNGKPNRKNEHFWATENPHFVNPIDNQGHFGINVWCGIINGHLIGPYFYEGILHSAHLFSLGGNKWRNLRVKLTPTFTSGKLKAMFQTLVDCGLVMEKYIKENTTNTEPVDIKNILDYEKKITANIPQSVTEIPGSAPGERFGVMQTKVGLACILKNFRVFLNDKTQLPIKMNPKKIIPEVQGGIWLTLKKLDSKI